MSETRKFMTNWLIAVTVLVAAIFTPPIHAQLPQAPEGESPSARHSDAIRVIAESYSLDPTDPSALNKALEHAGFPPAAMPEDVWYRLSPIDKISMWIDAADRTAPGIGHKQLRWLVIQRSADEPAILEHPLLKPLLEEGEDLPKQFEYLPTAPRGPPVGIDSKEWDILIEIDYYDSDLRLSSDPLSKIRVDAQRIGLDLSHAEARDLLYRHGDLTHTRAYLAGRAAGDQSENIRKIVRARFTDISQENHAIRSSPSITAYVAEPTQTTTPAVPPRGIVHNAVPDTAPTVPRGNVSRAMEQLVQSTFQSQRVPFSRMSGGVRGLGGIVFGNRVIGHESLSPVVVRYSQDDGAFVFTMTDGQHYKLNAVPPDVAQAAISMAFPTAPQVPQNDGNIGYPIASLIFDDAFDVVLIDEKHVRAGRHFGIAAHPALVDAGLAWSAICVDVIPIAHRFLGSRVRELGEHGEQIQEYADYVLPQLFRGMETEEFLGTWKIVDVPTLITFRTNTLVVERQVTDDHQFPDALRRAAFIELQPITTSNRWAHRMAMLLENYERAEAMTAYNRAYARRFYWHVPNLCLLSDDYARINNLARVFAALRWANQSGATFAGDRELHEAPEEMPDAVRVGADFIEPAVALSREEADAEASKKITSELARLTSRMENGEETALLLMESRMELLRLDARMRAPLDDNVESREWAREKRRIQNELDAIRGQGHDYERLDDLLRGFILINL